MTNLVQTVKILHWCRPQCNANFIIYNCSTQFSTSCLNYLDRKWRKESGLSANPNSFGPLTNLPDFTYLNGQPTPLGIRQKKRMLKQREYTETIIRLTKEMDSAVERHSGIKREEEKHRQNILDNKLKPKGHILISAK